MNLCNLIMAIVLHLHFESLTTISDIFMIAYGSTFQVVEVWPEKGVSGFVVYKYRLTRLEGQPKLTTKQVLSAIAIFKLQIKILSSVYICWCNKNQWKKT